MRRVDLTIGYSNIQEQSILTQKIHSATYLCRRARPTSSSSFQLDKHKRPWLTFIGSSVSAWWPASSASVACTASLST